MEMTSGARVLVSDPSCVAEARRMAARFAADRAWRDDDRARLSLIVTEMTTNLCKHAAGGEVFLTRFDAGDRSGLHVLAVDHGAGMRDVGRCFEDAYSTVGSPGTGLGAVRRLADHIDIYSTPGKGTVLFAEIAGHRQGGPASPFVVGGLSAPLRGEAVCGDAWAVAPAHGGLALLVVDGLGHGPYAAEAAQAAVSVFGAGRGQAPATLLENMHARLRGTRGAAAAVTTVPPGTGVVAHCGVGNISACLVEGSDVRHLLSHHGTLGYAAPRIAVSERPWTGRATLILASDGISQRWQPEDWPGLWVHHPAVTAGVLYRDHARARDDATIVAVARRP
jgi:anti-sigma regulatory factor (Ser/Thr protein kinase)